MFSVNKLHHVSGFMQGRRNMSQPGGAEIKWATLDCG